MSERNGDKARFQRNRKRKMLRRARSRELRAALAQDKAAKAEVPDSRKPAGQRA